MTVLDFSTTNSQITDEIINVSDSNPINLAHDIFYNKTGKLVVIRTAAAGGGTLLTLTTDYSVGGVFPDGSLPTSISPDVAYTTIAITNATYHDTDLYVSYYPIGDIISAERYNNLGGSTTVTTSATVDQNYVTNVNSATATITIPDGLPIGTRKIIRKISGSAGTVTIARSGSDVFTRASLTSLTLTSDGDFWVLEKVTSTRWELVDGVEMIVTGNDIYTKSSGGYLDYYTWGYVEGNGSSSIAISPTAITFFNSFYGSLVSPIGANTVSAPTSIDDFDTTIANASLSIRLESLTTFSLNIFRASSTFSSGVYYGYSVNITGRWYA